ncbi:peroxidase-related enzyme [soil metagenome]
MWIHVIPPDEADGRLGRLYDQLRTPTGHIDNVLQVHSLRPRTLEGHLALYKGTLHNPDIGLSPRERELVGVYVSALNSCNYCVVHHQAGLARILDDADFAAALVTASMGESDDDPRTAREKAMCAYATKLTRTPAALEEGDVEALRRAGLDDGEILDLNQVVAYFNYVNRSVLGLGVPVDDGPLGLAPDDESESYRHV